MQPYSLNVWKDRIIWTATSMTSAPSKRPAITLLIAAHGELSISTADGKSYTGRALLVGMNVRRSLAAEGGCYSLMFDPVHRLSRHLHRGLLADRDVIDLSDAVDEELLSLVTSAVEHPVDCAASYQVSEHILLALFPDMVGVEPIDTRVDMVANWLRTHVPKQVPLQQISELCGLSSGRLTHLVTEELGVSLRTYLMWVKMRCALEEFVRSTPLTEIAYAIGFSDSAHLSRVFKKMFALSPSFLANKALVRFRTCDHGALRLGKVSQPAIASGEGLPADGTG